MNTYEELAQVLINSKMFLGVRSLNADEQYDVGDDCRDSYEWDYENDCSTYYTTGETANGTCATMIGHSSDYDSSEELAKDIEKAVKANAIHGGKQVIIAGRQVNNDGVFETGEVRIVGAVVVAKLFSYGDRGTIEVKKV